MQTYKKVNLQPKIYYMLSCLYSKDRFKVNVAIIFWQSAREQQVKIYWEVFCSRAGGAQKKQTKLGKTTAE